MSDNSFERQIQELMGGLEFKPDAAVWNNIKAEIAPEKKRRFIFWWLPVLLLLLAGTGFWALHNTSGTAGNTEKNTITAHTNTDHAKGAATVPAHDLLSSTDSSHIQNEATTAHITVSDGTAVSGRTATTDRTTVTGHTAVTGTAIDPQSALATSNARRSRQPTAEAISYQWPLQADQQMLPSTGQPQLQDPSQPQQVSGHFSSYDYAIALQMPYTVSMAAATPLAAPEPPFQPAASAPPVIPVRKAAPKLIILPFVQGGMSKAKMEAEKSTGESVQSAAVSPPGIVNPVAVTPVTYTRDQFRSHAAFGLGALLDIPVSEKVSFQTGLRYQYASYSVLTSYVTDSLSRTSTLALTNYSVVNKTQDSRYRFHYIGVPLLLHYQFLQPVGITAGFMNDFVVAARLNGESISSGMNTWMPSAYFSLPVTIPVGIGRQWQLAPYVQYGLSTTRQESVRHRQMQAGVQLRYRLQP